MNSLFGDTSFFVAFLNPRDESHPLALEYMESFPGRIVTTVWVIAELGNFLCKGRNRRLFVPFVVNLRADSQVMIVGADNDYFDRGLERFARRPDKEWSFTDCISFVVMEDKGLTDALTADHHFEQAGFTILLATSG
jgi:predicted nucleic acid-binding protein